MFLSRLFLLFSKSHSWEAVCCSHLGHFMFHETFSPSLGPHFSFSVMMTFLSMQCPAAFSYWSWRVALGKVRLVPAEEKRAEEEVFHHLLRWEWERSGWVSSHTQSQGQYLPRRFQSHHKADCWLQITASCSPIHKQQHSFGSLRYTGFFFPLLTYQISDENLRVLSALMDMHLNHKKLRSGLVKCWQT